MSFELHQVESAVISAPEGLWMWVYVQGRGGVGRTLSPWLVTRCQRDCYTLLGVWRDLVGVLRRHQRQDYGRFGYGNVER